MPDPRRSTPDWLDRTDLAAWIREADDRIVHVNEAGRALLGIGIAMGRSCRELVRCGGHRGEALCSACPLRQRLAGGDPAAWVEGLRVGAHRRRADVLTLPLGEGGRRLQVALPRADEGRALGYLEHVARRHRRVVGPVARAGEHGLTPRQLEILRRLADDQDPRAIARALFISPVTVRNHVQHILAKLGVHSIQEAVAVFLLDASDG